MHFGTILKASPCCCPWDFTTEYLKVCVLGTFITILSEHREAYLIGSRHRCHSEWCDTSFSPKGGGDQISRQVGRKHF